MYRSRLRMKRETLLNRLLKLGPCRWVPFSRVLSYFQDLFSRCDFWDICENYEMFRNLKVNMFFLPQTPIFTVTVFAFVLCDIYSYLIAYSKFRIRHLYLSWQCWLQTSPSKGMFDIWSSFITSIFPYSPFLVCLNNSKLHPHRLTCNNS